MWAPEETGTAQQSSENPWTWNISKYFIVFCCLRAMCWLCKHSSGILTPNPLCQWAEGNPAVTISWQSPSLPWKTDNCLLLQSKFLLISQKIIPSSSFVHLTQILGTARCPGYKYFCLSCSLKSGSEFSGFILCSRCKCGVQTATEL